MFILVDNGTEGVYAVKAKDKSKIVQIFEKQDDAERYLVHLEAEDTPDKKNSNLRIAHIDIDMVASNCKQFGYRYSIIESDTLVVPPPKW